MTHGPTKIASKGACIYCGKTDVRLTDEHIVPLSLGGHHVIDDASCLVCADITKKFEQDVARNLWGDARIYYDAPSRRKKKRPKHKVLVDPDNRSRKLKVPFSDYPAPFVFYQMNQAGLLQGISESFDVSSNWKLITISEDSDLKKFEHKYKAKFSFKFKHVPQSFARLIAKIGYGQALTLLDIDDFRPICLPYILGEKENVSYVVGGKFEISEPNKDVGYVLKNACFGSLERMMILSEVRLLANNYTPIYHVVVGDVFGRENVKRVSKKLDGPDFSKITESSSILSNTEEDQHWVPTIWPLPFWTNDKNNDTNSNK